MSEYVKVAVEAEVQPGRLRRVSVDGADVLLANVGGTIHAVGADCTHDEGPLEEGELERHCIRCPWHFSLFDLRTGEVVESPAADPVPVYDVRVERGAIFVAIRASGPGA
jgi:3-phenylpropionate/trans-cinnamate dioxygenase ferredoxin component